VIRLTERIMADSKLLASSDGVSYDEGERETVQNSATIIQSKYVDTKYVIHSYDNHMIMIIIGYIIYMIVI